MPKYEPTLDSAFRALGDGTRRAVLAQLAIAPQSVSTLAAPFHMALPSFMQHLRVLQDCGLIRSEKAGRTRICHLEPAMLDATAQWITAQTDIWTARMDRMDNYIATLTPKDTR